MCGIAFLTENIDYSRVDHAFTSRLQMRGPDDFSVTSTNLGKLFHSRLQIVGGSESRQPFTSQTGSVSVVVNGEIYNHEALKRDLINVGSKFVSSSDCEVILHGYLRYGLAFIHKLDGQFAFIIVDETQSSIYLGRDRVGEKPLYYHWSEGFSPSLAIASDAKVLASLQPEIKLNREVIRDFFAYQFVPEDRSIFHSIKKVRPGSVVGFDLSSQQMHEIVFWDVSEAMSRDPVSTESVSTEKLAAVMEQSVLRACLGDAPPAIALSGGVDSSLIASICSKAQVGNSAFSIGHQNSTLLDESELAYNYAKQLGLDINISFSQKNIFDSNFYCAVDAMDEPFGDVSALQYFLLGKVAKRSGYKSILTGHGADELFWGYPWIYDAAKDPTRLGLGCNVFTCGLAYEYIYKNAAHFFGSEVDAIDLYPLSGVDTSDPAKEAFISLFNLYLRSNGAAQIDRMFMASGVEARSPFLDRVLIETICSQSNLFYPENPKGVLKKIAESYVFPEVLIRPKRGFQAPITDWINIAVRNNPKPYTEQSFLFSHSILNTPLILDQFFKGNHAVNNLLWCVIVFENWILSLNKNVSVN